MGGFLIIWEYFLFVNADAIIFRRVARPANLSEIIFM